MLIISIITLILILRGIAKGIVNPINQLAASANEITQYTSERVNKSDIVTKGMVSRFKMN